MSSLSAVVGTVLKIKPVMHVNNQGKLIVLNTDEARESFKPQETGINPKFEKRYEVLKGRIQEKLTEVNKQLKELDSKYKNMQ